MEAFKESKPRYMEFLQPETGGHRQTGGEDSYLFALLKAGDPRAAEEARRDFDSGLPDRLSDSPLRSAQYQFAAGAALAIRAARSVGLPKDRALQIGEEEIARMDALKRPESVREAYAGMIGRFAGEVASLEEKAVYSRDVAKSIDYIYDHLSQTISVQDVANHVGLSRSYFSTRFKEEIGQSISSYILARRVEAAKNMLRLSDIPYAEISSILAFSSQSHFIRVFKQQTGYTPREFRMRFSTAG